MEYRGNCPNCGIRVIVGHEKCWPLEAKVEEAVVEEVVEEAPVEEPKKEKTAAKPKKKTTPKKKAAKKA